jgi:hypothetical protein
VGPLEATRRARVRGALLARLTDAERTQLRAAEQRVAAAADDRDAATVVARLTWLTDFADRSSAPDFTRQPLYAYPRNAVVAAAPDQDRDRWLADPTSASGCADYRSRPSCCMASLTPSRPRASPTLPTCCPVPAGSSCPGWPYTVA